MQVESQLQLFEFGEEILPGVRALQNGTWHSPGHSIFEISTSSGPTLYHLGDVLDNEIVGIENPYLLSLFDTDRLDGPVGKTQMLDFLAETRAIAVFAHVTFPPAVRIVREGLFFRALKLVVRTAGSVSSTCPA